MPVEYLVQQPDPSVRFMTASSWLAERYHPVVNSAVQGYQLHSYLVLIETRFGAQTRQQVRQTLLQQSRSSGRDPSALESLLSLIDMGLQAGSRPAGGGGGVVKQVALPLTLLLNISVSPHFSLEQEERKAQIRRMDPELELRFAELLQRGRVAMENHFVPRLAEFAPDPDRFPTSAAGGRV